MIDEYVTVILYYLLGSILIICFISSSNPISKILSASSMMRHIKFFVIKCGVFCKWSTSRPGVATRILIPKKYYEISNSTINETTLSFLLFQSRDSLSKNNIFGKGF